LSQFSRRARWLNIFFPQSVAPASRDPGRLSDDVSLVQQYDGGGYGFAAEVEEEFIDVTQAVAGASGAYLLLQIPDDEILKILGCDSITQGGNAPTDAQITVQPTTPGGQPVSISQSEGLSAIGAQFTSWTFHAGVYGPDLDVQFRFSGGNAGTITRTKMYFKRAPLGTVFIGG